MRPKKITFHFFSNRAGQGVNLTMDTRVNLILQAPNSIWIRPAYEFKKQHVQLSPSLSLPLSHLSPSLTSSTEPADWC